MKIMTSYWKKPIPDRQFDWQAIDDETYDGLGSPIGHGATEREAISDLMDQMEDHTEYEYQDREPA